MKHTDLMNLGHFSPLSGDYNTDMLKFGPRKTNCWIGKRIHFLQEHVRIFPETQGSLDKRLGCFGGKSTMGVVPVTCLLLI